ncbi:unnamed protein product, partial [Effrenium voratum]
LQPDTTGFAIVLNRAALQVDTESLADRLGLQNVLGLLKNKMLHVVYFQSEAALPAALKMASKAQEEAVKAQQKAEMALQLARGKRCAGCHMVCFLAMPFFSSAVSGHCDGSRNQACQNGALANSF